MKRIILLSIGLLATVASQATSPLIGEHPMAFPRTESKTKELTLNHHSIEKQSRPSEIC